MPLPERKHRGFDKIVGVCGLFSFFSSSVGVCTYEGTRLIPGQQCRQLRVRAEPCSCGTADSGPAAPAPVTAASLPGFRWEAGLAGMPGLFLSSVLLALPKCLGFLKAKGLSCHPVKERWVIPLCSYWHFPARASQPARRTTEKYRCLPVRH